MTNFDARIVQRNAHSNKVIDGLVAQLKKGGATRVDVNMTDRVLRPFAHIMNECEIHNVDPEKVMGAMISTCVTMASEYMVRTTPKGNLTFIHAHVQTILDEFTQSLLDVVAANFGVKFETSQPSPVAPTTPH